VNNGKKVTGANSLNAQYNAISGDSYAHIQYRYIPMSSSNNCPADGSITIDTDSCKRFLMRALDDCKESSDPMYWHYGGIVVDYCACVTFDSMLNEAANGRMMEEVVLVEMEMLMEVLLLDQELAMETESGGGY
jgi:hypothetical protein